MRYIAPTVPVLDVQHEITRGMTSAALFVERRYRNLAAIGPVIDLTNETLGFSADGKCVSRGASDGYILRASSWFRPSNTSPLTVMWRAAPDVIDAATEANRVFVIARGATSSAVVTGFGQNNSVNIQLLDMAGGSIRLASATAAVGKWQTMILTGDGVNWYLYVDGVLASTGNKNDVAVGNSDGARLFSAMNVGSNIFQGKCSCLYTWLRLLSFDEVQDLSADPYLVWLNSHSNNSYLWASLRRRDFAPLFPI